MRAEKATRERWGEEGDRIIKVGELGNSNGFSLEVEPQVTPLHHFLLSDCILVFSSYLNNRSKEKTSCFTIAQPGYWISE